MLGISTAFFKNKVTLPCQNFMLVDDTVYRDRNGNVIGRIPNKQIEKTFIVQTTKTKYQVYGSPDKGKDTSDWEDTDHITAHHAEMTESAIIEGNYSLAHTRGYLIELYPLADRLADYRHVSKDNGSGDTLAANNREYSAVTDSSGRRTECIGAVFDPFIQGAYIDSRNGGKIMWHTHSHPSGYKKIGDETRSFLQPPSYDDIHSISSKKKGVVFGRGNDTVYIYGSKGVLALLSTKQYLERD